MVTSWKTAGLVASDASTGFTPWVSDDVSSALVGTECQADDNVYAGVILGTSGVSQWLRATNFGFSSSDIPNGSTINGFEVEYIRYRIGSITVSNSPVSLYKSGTYGTNIGEASDWALSEETITRGGASTLGGLTWTQSDVVASGFGVGIWIINGSTRASTTNRSRFIDQIRVRVYYTDGSSPVIPQDPMACGVWFC